jgi:16S rRNA processing protein RimM
METIPKTDCTQIGFIRKTHGVRGELTLDFEPVFELSLSESERLFVELDGLLVPFFIAEEGLRIKSSKSAIVKFDWVDTEEYARRLVGCPVFLFSYEIISDGEEMGFSDFENYQLEDETLGPIGKIIRVDDYSGNVVFTVLYQNSELLVPFNEELLISVDEQLQIIKLRLPEGLIDL